MESRASSVEVRLLGPVELWIDGGEVAIGGRRQRALLALLALRPGGVLPVDELIEELWAGEPTEGADTTLRSYVSRLRRSLGGAAGIERTDRGYVLSLPAAAVDALEFERLARNGADLVAGDAVRRGREMLVQALRLWRGRPFGDVGAEGTLAVAADRFEQLRMLAIERRIEADLALDRGAEVVDELEGLVRDHPFRERLWLHLMLALYRSGRQADALAAYHRARAALQDELGIEPGEELRALEAAILQQAVPAIERGAAEPSSLPLPVSSFVGREAELASLGPQLRTQRLVTLTGVGGVGKTRLALELARRAAEAFRDGVTFVDLSPLADPHLVAGELATALGVREQGEREVVDLLADHVRGTELLLVLDNCEHVREAIAGLVERLLLAGPSVHVLATSRAPLGVPGETEVPVAPLALASDAVTLFLARARSARPNLGDDADAAATAVRICTDLEGLPLAIELAAARARSLSLEEIAERLDDRFRFLVSWRRLTTARHRTLREAMDWSHELLAPAEQAVLAGVSVFAGGFSLAAVAAVAVAAAGPSVSADGDESGDASTDASGDEDAALQSIEALVEASLVIAGDGLLESRYRLLETVRQYAAQQLDESGRRAEVRRRHSAWFLRLAEAAAPELTGAGQNAWFARLETEQDNLRAALAFLAESGEAEEHLRLAIALTRFWYVRGHLAEGRGHLEQALQAESGNDPALRRRALTAAASLALLQGDHAAATTLAEEGLVVARQTGEPRLVANALSNLGAIVLAAGDTDRAGPLLEAAVTSAREAGDERILALAVNNLGDYSLTRGELERAGRLFDESLALLRARGDTANVARALFNLGASELELGRHDKAGERFREGLALARDAGDREDLAWILEGLAALAAARGSGERAALLVGAADAQLVAMGAEHKPYERSLRDRTDLAIARLLGSEGAAAGTARGNALALDDAIELGLGREADSPG
ncbi:MAG TPA: BTAD domain-containing putative transcriptional regulator [Candidatus Limnocylindrales bacterium]|nr:BTAD domain-containing putative transcriptional regulator [Candidatus Limnocylindrales bacterium]